MTEEKIIYDKRLGAYYAPWNRQVEFFLMGKDENGKVCRAVVKWVEVKDENIQEDVTFRLSEEFALEFVNQLWEAGFRPTSLKVSDSTVEAMKEHIADLRMIEAAFLKSFSEPWITMTGSKDA